MLFRSKAGVSALTVADVQAESPAAKGGLKVGMQIVEVNGRAPHSLVDFSEQVVGLTEGRDVALVVLDAGVRRSLKVKMEPFESVVKRRTGLTLEEITPQSASRLGLQDRQGLLITAVEKGSPADAAELKSGMLVTGIDSAAVNELRDFGYALINKGTDNQARLTIIGFQRIADRFVQPVQGRVDLKMRGL